jgi:putative membrane protein insertion efficiency factor
MTDPVAGSRPQTWAQRRALRWIEAYQRAFAGRPSPCRFYPTCSNYAHEAFEVHGTARGGWLTVTRLLRCRPFGPSGFDPVPDALPHVHAATPGADPVIASPIREVD